MTQQLPQLNIPNEWLVRRENVVSCFFIVSCISSIEILSPVKALVRTMNLSTRSRMYVGVI